MEQLSVTQSTQGLLARHNLNMANDLISSFLSGKSPMTLKAYRQDLEDFRSFVDVPSLDAAARLLLGSTLGEANSLALNYKANLREKGLQPASINRRLASLRSLVRLARTLGLVPWALEVRNDRVVTYRDTRGPGNSNLSKVLDNIDANHPGKSSRDRAILLLLHDLGLRRGEAVSLDVADVDLTTGTISVIGKGRREKEKLSVPKSTCAAIRDWLTFRGLEPGPLFLNFDRAGKGKRLTGTSLYRIIRQLGEDVGVRVRPHGIRHTAITEACKVAHANGIPLEEVLHFSRHKDIKTLLIYRDGERNVQGHLAGLVAARMGRTRNGYEAE